MKKIDSSLLVCTSAQSQMLLSLGILPAGTFCYEWYQAYDEPENSKYEYAGEYSGQLPETVLPAWTYEELCVMIGGELAKPDIMGKSEFTPNVNLNQYCLYLPKSKKYFANGARAAADMLTHMLSHKMILPEECNSRFEEFYKKDFTVQ
jgi:hypothetical protein